jgi:serine/threonine protein phosphatase 1
MSDTRKFVVGDIHGCKKTFEALLDRIHFSSSDQLYLLGDYIDRGPDSEGVLAMILQLMASGHQVFPLMGNHEEIFIQACRECIYSGEWHKEVPAGMLPPTPELVEKYLPFLVSLPAFREVDNYILVHAGLNFKVANPLSAKSEMLWIRHWYETINYDWLKDRIVLHGHTPMTVEVITQQHRTLSQNQYLNLDNGCVFGKYRLEYEHLYCFEMSSQMLVAQRYVE